MKVTSFVSIALLSAALIACDEKIDTPNGELPAELVPAAAALTGEYRGQVERESNQMTIQLEGSRIQLTLAADMIAPACGSRIGRMLNVTVANKKDEPAKVVGAQFEFDANLCANDFEGERLYVHFLDDKTFETSVLERIEYRTYCDGFYPPNPPAYPNPFPPGYSCRREAVSIYRDGRFSR